MRGSFGQSRSFTELVRSLAHSGAHLVRSEVKLARLELAAIARNVARGTARVALGGVLLLLGVLSLCAALVLVAGDQWLPRDRYWTAALLVMGITAAVAVWAARRGAARLAPSELAPDQTLGTLTEDKEWLKQQLT